MAATFSDSDGALRLQEGLVALHARRSQITEWEVAARSALRFAIEAGDHAGRTWALDNLTLALAAADRPDEAAETAAQVLQLQHEVINAARNAPSPRAAGDSLRQAFDAVLGGDRLLGQHDGRLVYELCLKIAKTVAEFGPPRLDEAYMDLGLRALWTAAETARRAGNNLQNALACAHLALERHRTGRATGSFAVCERALQLMPEAVDEDEAGPWQEVCELLERFCRVQPRDETGNKKGVFNARRWRISLLAYERIGDRVAQARLLTEIAQESFELGDYQSAVIGHRRARTIRGELGIAADQGAVLAALAYTFLLRSNYKQAVELAEPGIALLIDDEHRAKAWRALSMPTRYGSYEARETNRQEGQVAALLILGLVLKDTGNGEGATALCRQAMDLAHRIGNSSFPRWTAEILIDEGFSVT